MANWNTLKTAVADVINANGNQAITGQLLQNVLNNIITNVGENATFAGIATLDTNPGAPDGPVFYLTVTAGTYPNFNGIEVQDGEAVILLWDNNAWSKKVTGFATQEKLSQLGQNVNSLYSRNGYPKVISDTMYNANIAGKIGSMASTPLYDCTIIELSGYSNRGVLSVFGATPSSFFFFSDEIGTSFQQYNTTGLIPDGSKVCVINFLKENNVIGYDSLQVTYGLTSTNKTELKTVVENFGVSLEKLGIMLSPLNSTEILNNSITEGVNGAYISANSSAIRPYELYSISELIELTKGSTIVVNCTANTAISVISLYDKVTTSYQIVVVGETEDNKEYKYTAFKDCEVVISYNNTKDARYSIVESQTLKDIAIHIDESSTLTQGLEPSSNLINPANIINGFCISATTGELFSYDGSILSGLISVLPNTRYYIKRTEGSGSNTCRFLTSDMEIIKPLTYNGNEYSSYEVGTDVVVTSPSNAAYLQVQIKLNRGKLTDCIVAESATPIPYIPHIVPVGYENYAKLSETCGKNLFDKDSIIEGKFISQTDGGLYNAEGWAISDMIKVSAGEAYTFSGLGDTIDVRGLAADKTTKVKLLEDSTYWQTPTQVAIPEGVEYVQFTVRRTSIDYTETAQLEKGYIATDYEEYQKRHVVPFDNLPYQLQPTNAGSTNNILYGKIVSFNGDSICQGAENSGGYGKIIAQRNGMVYQNVGISGGTIIGGTYIGDTARHWISRTISRMREDADYAIVEGGVNDASLNLPLGSITEGYSDNFDDTTFYGAFESMLRQLTIRFAGKKIGYIAVHQMTKNFSVMGDKETNYYWAAKKCCEKWGVPFCDLNITVPPFDLFSDSDAELKALKDAYFYNSDGWHPNEEGYKKYYCDKIESWMKTL